MRNTTRRRGYILMALGGAVAGGLAVAVVTKALTGMMGKMHKVMSD